MHEIYLKYMDWCMPIIGKWASGGDASAYQYLLKGVHEFPNQDVFKAEIEAAGFRNVSNDTLTLGIAAVHRAEKLS